MDSWNLTAVSLLAYTDPNEPFILYTDAYDITIGAALRGEPHQGKIINTKAVTTAMFFKLHASFLHTWLIIDVSIICQKDFDI